MLDTLTPTVRGLILDMDGVLWRDDSPIGDLQAIFDRIRERELKVALATNNATKTVDEYLEKLHSFGVLLESWQIVTSSDALAQILVDKFFPSHPDHDIDKKDRRAIFVLGENGVISALREKGFTPIIDPEEETRPLAVVSSFDRKLTYAKLRRATLHVRAGVPLFATNADRSFPTPDGLIPGAGAILAALEAATDVRATVVGKPSPVMMELAARRMELGNAEILVVGDRLETDIAGGQAMQARTGLVLSGVTKKDQAIEWRPKPDLIAEDLSSLIK